MKITHTYYTVLHADRLHPSDETFLRVHANDTDDYGNRVLPEYVANMLAEIDALRVEVAALKRRYQRKA